MKRIGALSAVLLVMSCSSGALPRALHVATHPSAPASTVIRLDRIAIVVMENKEYDGVIGRPDATYTNALARRSALATSMYATSHPSLPNYLALTAGDTFGIHSDCTDCHVAATSIVDQLEAAHISWKAYMEGLPARCFTDASSGRYAKKHNPFVYYDRVTNDARRCANVVPFSELDGDIAAHRLPRFVWITPDLCDDTHDCSVGVGDAFLSHLAPRLIGALGPRGALFLTYDEGTSARGCCGVHGGHIVTIVAGGAARPGVYTQPLTQASILRAIEDAFGLPRLRSAATAPPMDGLLR